MPVFPCCHRFRKVLIFTDCLFVNLSCNHSMTNLEEQNVLIKRDKFANLCEITLQEQHLSPIIKTLFYCVIIFFITFRLHISSSLVFFHYQALFTAFARHFGCQSPCLLLSISRLTYSIVNVLPYYSFFLHHSTVGNNTFLCSLFRLNIFKQILKWLIKFFAIYFYFRNCKI